MNRVQKVTAVVSVIVILVLAAALGLFMWKEDHEDETVWETHAEDVGRESEGETRENSTGGEDDERTGTDVEALNSGESEYSNEDSLSEEEPASFEEEQKMLENQKPEIEDASLVFTGDVMFGGSVRGNYDSSGLDGILSPYLQQEMKEADITMVNEEFPFSQRGTPMEGKQYTFRVDKSYLSAFLEMGIDVVSLANNHALDYGTEALIDTFDALDEVGIPYVGAGADKERAEEAVFIERGGRTVGILSASRVIPVVSWNIENQQPGLFCTYDSAALKAAIERTREQCDYLVVYVHWGVERKEYPEQYQRTLAQIYIDAGADLVVGSHPHVPQGIEYYQGKPIVYSLGNFIFNPNMARTYMLKVVWDAAGESQLKVIPVETVNALTGELTDEAKQEMITYIESISYGVAIDENGMVTPQ